MSPFAYHAPAGRPGEIITSPARRYYKSWGRWNRALVGEVSSVNDDNTDHRFIEPIGRFAGIQDDETPLYFLVTDIQSTIETFSFLIPLGRSNVKMLNWGIIGAGYIARIFANAMRFSQTGRVAAIASRSGEQADRFAKAFSIEKAYASYEDLLADSEVKVVYIANIHPAHAEWTIKSAEAGKHILVEKPIGMNFVEAAAMIDAARANDVFLMEGFMYRCHPQTKKLVEMVRNGAIGQVKMLRAAFSYYAAFDSTSRSYANGLGGGAIVDVGAYTVSMARLIAGAAAGKPFLDAFEIKGYAKLGPTGVDEYGAATVRFENDVIAELITGVACEVPSEVVVYGTEGRIVVPDPWIPSSPCRAATGPLPLNTHFPPSHIMLHRNGPEVEDVLVETDRDLFTYEADTVAENISHRQAPEMSWEDTLGNMRLLDRWREEVGLVYEGEKRFHALTLACRPLAHQPQNSMKYGEIPGLEKPVSRLVQGADRNLTVPYTGVLFDQFFELGGNAFDTSNGYAGGKCAANLGAWIRARGIRDEVVVIEKGGNPPNGTPEGIRKELLLGLERLGLDSVDIWMMHRDNPEVPVGEIVDVLNELQAAGHMTVFGVSNWSLPRLKEAKTFADRNRLRYFTVVSNQFSLARILDVWWNKEGAYWYWMTASNPEFRRWFEETQMVLMPWSSQASGFFVEQKQGMPDVFDLARCWHSEDNFKRRERAFELASKYGVEATNIALAWVLCQKFPVYPLIGPRQPDETRSCMRALDISLSDQELRWLDLED